MKRYIILITGLILSTIQLSIAGDAKFTATASKTKVATGERFQISFSLNTSGSDFKPPSITNFQVAGGPNQSSSMQWINGNVSQSITYSYVLVAVKEGTFTIKPASIKAGGQTIQSNELTIEVVKGSPVPQQSQRPPPSNPQAQRSTTSSQDIGDELFLKVSVDKSKVYLGEPITATYKIYTRVNIVNNSVNKLPALNGFWSQDIESKSNQAQLYQEVVDGVPYQVADLKKTILFPQRTGTLDIDPLGLDCVVRTRSNKRVQSLFDQFFGTYEDIQVAIKSNSVKIQVMPLPEADKPVNFAGAVGKFTMTAKVDKQKVKTNEGLNLSVTVSGKGNLKLIEAVKPTIPEDIESYDPKITDNITTTAAGVNGSKTFEYLLIPRYAGKFKIEPVEFSYFDPATKTYETIRSEAFEIEVEKGKDEEAVVMSSTQKSDLKMLGSDIRFIKTDSGSLTSKGTFFFGSFLFYVFLAIPPVFFLAFLLFFKQYQKSNSDIIQVKYRKATKLATKHLDVAKKHLNNKASRLFYEEIFKALYGYLSDKLTIPVADLSKETITETLERKNLNRETIQNLIKTLDHCELARFAPVSNVSEQEVYSRAVDIISKVEQELK